MTPNFAVNNALGMTPAINSEFPGQPFEGPHFWILLAKTTHLYDLIIGQFCLSTFFSSLDDRCSSKNPEGMKIILGLSYPLNVLKSIVIAYAVLMVGLSSVSWSTKCSKNKNVNLMLSRCCIFPKRDELVFLVVEGFQYLASQEMPSVRPWTVKAAYTSLVGYLVQAFVSRYIFPDFMSIQHD